MKIAIIGAGAAGLVCACLIKEGHEVVVFERNETAGKKLLMTGGGRCNLSNFVGVQDFLHSVSRGREFIEYAINEFGPSDAMDFFEGLGVNLKVEPDGKVFPSSNKGAEVRDALLKCAVDRGVEFRFNQRILGVEKRDGLFGVAVDSGKLYFDKVVIGTGGLSYSKTGSSGDGYEFGRGFGHEVVDARASLCGLVLKKAAGFMGTSLECEVEVMDKDKKVVVTKECGNVMFTKRGLGGPVIFKMSSLFDGDRIEGCFLRVNFVPRLKRQQFFGELRKMGADKPFYLFRKWLPINICNWLIEVGGIDKGKALGKMSESEKDRLFGVLTGAVLEIEDFENIEGAIVTRGGINLGEIDKKTMQSKLVHGLYFVGEVLDIDGLTGGFNLQIAFSTAAACAKSLSL